MGSPSPVACPARSPAGMPRRRQSCAPRPIPTQGGPTRSRSGDRRVAPRADANGERTRRGGGVAGVGRAGPRCGGRHPVAPGWRSQVTQGIAETVRAPCAGASPGGSVARARSRAPIPKWRMRAGRTGRDDRGARCGRVPTDSGGATRRSAPVLRGRDPAALVAAARRRGSTRSTPRKTISRGHADTTRRGSCHCAVRVAPRGQAARPAPPPITRRRGPRNTRTATGCRVPIRRRRASPRSVPGERAPPRPCRGTARGTGLSPRGSCPVPRP